MMHVLPTQGSKVYIIPIDENGIVKKCQRDDEQKIIIYVIRDDGKVHLCREFEIVPDWSTIYENGECPDCGEIIPKDTPDGGKCANCEHVFWVMRPF